MKMKLNKQQQRRFEKARDKAKANPKSTFGKSVHPDEKDIPDFYPYLKFRSEFKQFGFGEFLFKKGDATVLCGYLSLQPTPVFWIHELGTKSDTGMDIRMLGYNVGRDIHKRVPSRLHGDVNAIGQHITSELIALFDQCDGMRVECVGVGNGMDDRAGSGKWYWNVATKLPDRKPDYYGKYQEYQFNVDGSVNLADKIVEMSNMAHSE